MRDRKRIKRILSKLQKLWFRNPDMRFGQLLSNYIYSEGDISWNEEDTELESTLDEVLNSKEENNNEHDENMFDNESSKRKRRKDIFDKIAESDVLY